MDSTIVVPDGMKCSRCSFTLKSENHALLKNRVCRCRDCLRWCNLEGLAKYPALNLWSKVTVIADLYRDDYFPQAFSDPELARDFCRQKREEDGDYT